MVNGLRNKKFVKTNNMKRAFILITGILMMTTHLMSQDRRDRMDRLGWRHAARTARHHFSSRLHAATLLPSAIRRGSGEGVRTLAGYVFGPARAGRSVGGGTR